ncbi:hypothetical protein OG590_39855 (plasmid) [Streptomyces goshikiensis]|uniref:hypothetical protein n=1 Tax=Streptomyces goshikiensis TaxID=1942 RepID=UPI002F9147A6|nr:hypothetical protein OG590_39855 [Streptomyces goshikiensis]
MNRPLPIWRRVRLLGTARLRLALLLAALAATAITMLTSLPALADPTPAPSSSPSAGPGLPPPTGERTPTPEEIEEIEKLLAEMNGHVSDTLRDAFRKSEEDRIRKLLPDEGGLLAVFNVTDRTGMPVSAYTVKGDTGGLTDWDLGIENLITELCFMIVKWLIAFCCWLIAWSLSFGLAKLLLTPVLSVATSLHTQVILQLGLPSLFLSVCALITVARVFFGDRAKGWGDAALSLLIAGLTTTLLASPPQLLLGEKDSALAVARGVALEVADIILDAGPHQSPQDAQDAHDEDSASGSTLARPLTDALTDAFVVKPAMLLQYGRVFEGDCAKKYSDTKVSQIAFERQVAQYAERLKKLNQYRYYFDPTAATVTDWTMPLAQRWAVDHFGNPPMETFEKDCVHGDAKAAKRASMDKVGGAVFLLVAALIVTVLISGLSGSFLVAQCRIAWDAVRAEPALVAGIVPGAGRAYLWDLCAAVLHSLGMLLASVIGLAVLILVIQAVLDPVQQDWGRELTLRFLAVDIVCIGAVKKRKALTARSRQVANNFRAKMAAGRVGGTNGSIFTPTPAPQDRSIARTALRGAVRTAMVGVSLAQGNPLSAISYAASSSISTAALMTRIQSGGNGRKPSAARPAGQPPQAQPHPPAQAPAQAQPQPQPPAGPQNPPAAPPGSPDPSDQSVPQQAPDAPDDSPTQATTVPAGSQSTTTPSQGTPTPAQEAARQARRQRMRPRHDVPVQPAGSARQQQLRQRLDRGSRPATRRPGDQTGTPRAAGEAVATPASARQERLRRRLDNRRQAANRVPAQRPTDASLTRGEEEELERRRQRDSS